MKGIGIATVVLFLGSLAMAAEVKCEGTFTTSYKNNRPNVVTGQVAEKEKGTWQGELTTDWNGKVQTFQGTMTGDLKNGDVKLDFYLMMGTKQTRHFVFTCKSTNGKMKGKIIELAAGGKEVPSGELELEAKVGGAGATKGGGTAPRTK